MFVEIGEDFDTYDLRQRKLEYMYALDPYTRAQFYYHYNPGPIVKQIADNGEVVEVVAPKEAPPPTVLHESMAVAPLPIQHYAPV